MPEASTRSQARSTKQCQNSNIKFSKQTHASYVLNFEHYGFVYDFDIRMSYEQSFFKEV